MAYLRDRRAFGNIGTRRFRGARFGDPLSPRFTGLLDQYGGAAAAYSLRALSSGWLAGDVVEVRRSSDSTTQDFTSSQITGGQMLDFVNNDTTSLYNALMYFDGVDDYVDTSLASGEVFTGFTAAVKAQSLAPGRFISTRHSSNQGFILRYSGTASYEAVIATSAGTVVLNSGAVSGYEIKEVVATWEGTTAKLYIDGLEVDSTALAGTMTTSTSLKIGASETTANFFQTGIVYDVRIFDSALSPAAVSTLYDNAADGSEFAAYMGDGTANSNWVDTSGNGYNGTVFGTPAAYTGQPFDGFVSTWYDQSGNANDAVQATTTSQPKIVDAGVLVSGGLDFDGVDDGLSPSSGFFSNIQDCAFFSVATREASSTGYISQASPAINRYYIRGGLCQYGDPPETNSYTIGNDVQFLLTSSSSSGNATLYIDSVDDGDITYGESGGGASGIGANTTISSAFWDGKIAEIIAYDSDQSANRAAIEANINNQYDIY